MNRDKKFEELPIAEFAAGYSAIIEQSSDAKRDHRLAHLRELLYLARKYQWKHVLNYHAACLLEIERGHMRWGDSFQSLQSTTLAGGFLISNNRNGSGPSTSSNSNAPPSSKSNSEENGHVLFCKAYQRGPCTHTQDHFGMYWGEN